ncbi:(2Fe-2S)-binding protein [Ochrobactrum sp. GRS2]|nr:(2Fe-2S)-binding protein [Ochrobactrum sp. GRS2]
MSIPTREIKLNINGQQVGPMTVPEELSMVDFLHEYADLTGSRFGCGQGLCRACTVIVDEPDGTSREMRTCITGAHYFNGRSIRTVEGHATKGEGGQLKLSAIQEAFLDHFSFQCSYCAPGFVNAATVLVERLQKEPVAKEDVKQVIEDSLNDHICRCTGYVRYYSAVHDVVMNTPGLVK